MAVDYCFKFPLPNGLHARPASHFQAITKRFRSKVELIHERTCYKANVRSVLSMVSADIKWEDPCRVQITGEDEQPAMEAVRSFLKNVLPHCDEALPEIAPAAMASLAEIALPRSLKSAGLRSYLRGTPVSGGVGWGDVVLIGCVALPPELEQETATNLAAEQDKASSAIAQVSAAINAKVDAARHPQEIQVLKAHAAIVSDVALAELVAELIDSKRRTAAQAIVEACRTFTDALRNAHSAYLRERILDIEDVCTQLLERIVWPGAIRVTPQLTSPSICVADQMTPGQFLALDREHLKGLVLSDGGTTSHTVILARSMNVPTLVRVPKAMAALRPGQEAILDGELGLLVTEIPEAVRRYYRMERDTLARRRRQLDAFRTQPGKTLDGRSIEVAANVASAEEVAIAMRGGAQGIGLFRTEMLFMDRAAPPGEQEQTDIYTAAVTAAAGQPVIIRLIDIGGDKPAPYLNLPAEANPFLGYRGARLYREFAELVKTQLRAILRASAAGAGSVKILVPMVSCLEEVRDVRRLLSEAAEELAKIGFNIERLPPLGVMIEVPSVAFIMPELCREVDFFSIGSNDLIQYFLAADRANQKVSSLYTWSHPAFLRLLKSVADQAKDHGKWIGLCGEMGDAPAALPLLTGLGLDEISVSVPRLGDAKAAINASRFTHCKQLLDAAVKCGTRAEVESLLQESLAASDDNAPVFSADLIVQSNGVTKEEVIRELTNTLHLANRVPRRQALEDAIWRREDAYSTGFGHGFAVPHCKCDCLTANSMAIAKLATPVEWGSMDGRPVDVVILLAIRAQDHAQQHMRIFARLSRLVMREEFRERIRQMQDPAELAAYIEGELDQRPQPATA